MQEDTPDVAILRAVQGIGNMLCTHMVPINKIQKDTMRKRLANINQLYTTVLRPCGICMACRINKARDWSIRLNAEHMYHSKSAFVTLTYDDKYLPVSKHNIPTLRKTHIKSWIKKIRKTYPKIKYYLSGEYGDTSNRPHYHAIIFGMSIKDCSINGYHKWQKCSSLGFHVEMCIPETISYVAKYILKKLHGKSKKLYEIQDIEPPFALMSKSLGLNYLLDNRDILLHNQCILSPNGKKFPLPKYYVEKLGIEYPYKTEEEYIDWYDHYISSNQRNKNLIGKQYLISLKKGPNL